MTMTQNEWDTAGERYAHEAEQGGWERLADEDRFSQMATPGDAHREWHLNSGVPMGLPGCPQDACHAEYLSRSEVKRLVRQREINFAHMRGEVGTATISCSHCHGIHLAVGYVRSCSGVSAPQAPTHVPMDWTVPPVPREEPIVQGQYPSRVAESLGTHRPEISAEDAVAKMRAAQERKEAEEAAAKRARYAAWRSIPVYAGGRGYYALEMDGSTHYFKVSRPKEGPHKGKTFVEEQAGDAFHKMGWVRTGQVLDAIAAAPEAAGLLYGQTIGRCYRCHRTLTDAESRAAGIGPDCAKKG